MKHVLLAALFLLIGSFAFAEDAAPEPENFFSIEGTLDLKTAYYFRGYKLMNKPVIQADITISTREFAFGEVGVTPYLNLWNNISRDQGDSDATFSHWTETGVNPGVAFSYQNWTLDFIYYATFLPSGTGDGDLDRRGAIGQAQELDITLSYDDATDETGTVGCFNYSKGAFTPIALQPYVLYVVEFQDRADFDLNQYIEFGFSPELTFGEKWTVSFPTMLGCSLDGYYVGGDGHNDFFGYVGTGIHAKYQLNQNWDIHGGVDYTYDLSGGITDYNHDYSGGGSRHNFVGFIGVGFSF